MSDDHPGDLGDRLRGLVPDPPAAPGRAASAIERSRRGRRARTTAAVVGAAAAVAVVVGAMTLVPGGQVAEPGGPATSAATPSVTTTSDPTPVSDDVTCPEPQRRGDPFDDPTEQAPLPVGPVAVRMCSLTVPSYGGFRAPLDGLTGEAAAEFQELAESQEVDDREEPACNADGGITYAFVLGYPDGTRRIVTAGDYGCGWVAGAGPRRFGAEDVLAGFERALHEQRAASEPPEDAVPDLACPGAAPWPDTPTYRPAETTTAVLCVQETDREAETPWRAVAVPGGDLEVLLADLLEPGPGTERPDDCPAGPRLALVGATEWGDAGSAAGFECGGWYLGNGAEQVLTPAAQAVVDRLVAQAPSSPAPEPTARMTPDEALNAVVDLVNDGRLDDAREHTVAPELLDAGGRIDVKTGGWEKVPTPRSVSADVRLADVELIYRVGGGEYRDAVARLSRLPGQPWYVVSIALGDVVPTGD